MSKMATKTCKEADHLYVLMTDRYRISRNMRANWYFNRLNTYVSIEPNTSLENFNNEIDLVSVLPSNYQDYQDLGSDSQYSGQYFISTNTKVTFFSRRYRLAYVLDLSPSVSLVDIQRNRVLLDEMLTSVATSLRGLVQPFYVPGSQFLFTPEIFVTIIAYIPFYSCDNQQVLAQGWKITSENIGSFFEFLSESLSEVISSVSEISAKAKEEREDDQSESDVLIGHLFDENDNKKSKSSETLLATPDISMVNILRIGLLALQLLPENSSAGIVVVTDGMMSLPNANTLESALTQLRNHTISCSFLQIGSSAHPHSCFGFIPYTELMKFISTATFGAYLSVCPDISSERSHDNYDYNLYHRAFLAWNFQRGLFGFRADINHKQSRNPLNEWHVDNAYFYSTDDYGLNSNRETRDQQIVRNKQIENTVSADLTQVLSCRLREGYTIKSVNYSPNENQLEVRLLLPWRHNVNIEYNLSSVLSTDSLLANTEDSGPQCHYEVIVEGSYNFLHDVTCAIRKPIKSAYRSATIKQFWTTLKSLSDSDKHEVHLHNFTRNAWTRSIPESIKNGVPLFYMPPNSTEAVISSKNQVHTQFAQQWKWMLDVECMQKWMHIHRINVILEHDFPLPKHLHLPNTSGRFQTVQCRQALSSLNVVLTESSSFVLLENHSYIKLLENCANESPHSFYLIRVISQPPSVVIHLAFVGGTAGQLRNEIVTDLKDRLKNCKLPKRSISSMSYPKSKTSQSSTSDNTNDKTKSERKTPSPSQKQWVDINCCVLLNKPIDKILIRYDRMPKDFSGIMDQSLFSQNQTLNGSNPSHTSAQHLSSLNIFQTLSRYLCHQRWIWTTNYGPNLWLSSASLAKILTVLMKMRLQEGFHFAHNDSGILNMVQELPIKDQNDYNFSSVVQYIIFPPHVINPSGDRIHFESLSDDEDLELTEDDGELQLITECWVEPQLGISYDCIGRKEFLDGLDYKQISRAFFAIDLEAISCLLTFEHSLILCQNNEIEYQSEQISTNQITLSPDHHLNHISPTYMGGSSPDIAAVVTSSLPSERIQTVKYRFDIIGLLSKAQQAVILFSTLFQDLKPNHREEALLSDFSDITNELLLELLFSKISTIHDREIKLSQNDCISFINQVNQRHDSSNSDHFLKRSAAESGSSFRCFIKKLSANSILITLIPSTFNDLKLLVYDNDINSIDSLNIFHEIDDNNPSSDHSFYGSLSLPIFIYKTSFNSLSDQLVYLSDGKPWKDLYLDNTYKSQKSDSTNYPFKLFRNNESENESLSKGSIRQFCRSLQLIYWNCMTKALYRALQFDHYIDKRDILNIVDNISDKFVLNIDVSKFFIYLCEHLKEYLIKSNTNEKPFDINNLIETNFQSDATSEAKTFALSDLLASLKSCSDIKELHFDIKNKFQTTLQHYMSPIPDFPSFYFFNYKNSATLENSVSDSNLADKSLVNSMNEELPKNSAINNTINAIINETKGNVIKSDEPFSHSTLKSCPKNEINDENASLSKSNSSKVSCNALDITSEDLSSTPNLCTTSKAETLNSDTYLDTSSQPLFLRLSCSLQTQSGIKECFPHSLPTCLRDITDLLDSQPSETHLKELKISLNLICLTQSDEISAQSLLPLLQKRDSVVSNDYLNNTEAVDQIVREETNNQKLSEYQFQTLDDCIDKINWLLNDEIVSIALDSYPICESTLEMVITHIEDSPTTDFSFKKQVRLQFVFGNENNVNYDVSLNRFCESMARIKLPGFQLKRIGKYYYISDEKEANEGSKQTKDTQKYLSSLIPSLSSNLCLHFNDAINDSNRDLIDSKDIQNSETSFSTPLSQNTFNFLKLNDRTKTTENLSDDSLDDNDMNETHKKQMSRKFLKSRSASVPPTTSYEEISGKRKTVQSLPEADLEFIKRPKHKNKTKFNKQNDNEKQLKNVSTDGLNIKNSDTYCSENENFKNDDNNGDNDEEEGYEGDSDDDSEADNENWMALDSKQPLAPKFWLIMNITNDSVILYFHTRPKDTSSKSYTKGIEIFNHVIVLVESICKTVNQMLLLKDLHDTRMCDDLLVPIEDNDPWSKASRRHGLQRTQLTHESDNDTDVELNITKNESKLTKTNISFTSGSFACCIVWDKHFPLHPRLQSGPSRGISAMRTFLNSFSVNNRKNLFVYQESLNSVFYLRLYEINCSKHIYNKEIRSLNCSKSPSESSLFVQNKRINSEDLSESRNRVDSNLSDKDNDSLSLTSVTSSHFMRTNSDRLQQTQCILLNVHGIRDVGKDIKEEMVGALQKKLDEAVLEILIIMLSRNPHSKLSPEDVSFIQKCYAEPTETFRFTIDAQYIQCIHSIKVYLRQNLLTFMHNPKYTESNPEFHFKIQNPNNTIETNDFDTFLYYRQQSFGSDSKGIACIVLSLVDGKGDSVPHNSCPSLESIGQTELKPLLSGSFDEVTKCERYNGVSAFEKIALIQFQIWSVGKIDLIDLSKKLQLAIKHAIWDLTLEFKILMASLNREFAFTEVMSNSFSVSEPSTPKNVANLSRGRKSGRQTIETSHLSRLESFMSSSSSVPNIVRKTEDIFEFPELTQKSYESPKQSILRMNSETTYKEDSIEIEELVSLSYVLNLLVRPWLDFGRNLEVVSVVKQQYSIVMRHSIPYVIKEFKNYIQNSSPHMSLNAFKKSSDFMYSPCNDFEIFEHNSQFESIMDLIVLVRHEKLWKAGESPSVGDNLETYFQTKGERPKLRFSPHTCNIKSKTSTIEAKPVLAVSNSSLNSSIPENRSHGSECLSCVAPRQKFLLLYVEDKQITLYLYNWSNEFLTTICKNLSNIISWHNSRGAFLQSIITQKAGIFQNQPYKRKNSNNLTLHSFASSLQTVSSSSNLTQYFKNQKQRFNSFTASMNENLDLLIKHHNPVAAAQEYSQTKKLYPQTMTGSYNLCKCFRDQWYLTPLQATNLSKIRDLVNRFGKQIKLCQSNCQSKELLELSKIWHTQGTKLHFNPVLDKVIKQVKHFGRLNHYCLTPLLFSPKWRLTVSPVRDHSLQSTDNFEDNTKVFINEKQRLRHASGGYVKKSEETDALFNRSRRQSGPAVSWSVPKTTIDESWHLAVCSHYIQEYVQYLQTLGFGAIQMRSHRLISSASKSKSISENSMSTLKLINKSFANRKLTQKGENERYFLIKSLLGGLLVFEVGFSEPYVFSHLYSFDAKRFEICNRNRKSIDNSLSQTFLDELDKIKSTMHLHSFTYDYHLRTIHSYISGRQLIFRQGYHLTSFLDDFIKYYQKAPNYARNYVYSGQISIDNICVPSQQLYNYIISHNDSYGMKVFRMNSPVSPEEDFELTNEYVLVEMSSHRVPYRDSNDTRQIDNFDVGVLITHDFTNIVTKDTALTLKFFVLLTSQRELFPKLFSSHFGSHSKGHFKPIRLYASQPSSGSHSRKSSTMTDPNLSDESFSDASVKSTKELTLSTSSGLIPSSMDRNIAKSVPLLSTSMGICDEEITYLGYFSSHETMMLQILHDKANDTQIQLTNAVKRAAIDCRREMLWTCLLPRKTIYSDSEEIHLTYAEFDELLALVEMIKLDEYDPRLRPFTGLHISWYQGLAKTLVFKSGMSFRNFSSPDGKAIKLVLTQNNCLESFVLLNIDLNVGLGEICLVFKKLMSNGDRNAYLETSGLQCHSLVEELVNGCAYYMWSAIP